MKTVAATVIMVAIIAAIGTAPSLQGGGSNHTVTQADMDRWKVELSNWGRWGKDDEKGTLNLITPQKRKQAADLVRDGVAISLARPANTEKAIDNPQPYENVMLSVRGPASSDRIAVSFHGYAHTHLDALGHHFFDGKLYNGFSRDEHVTMGGGAAKGSIYNVKDGVFTRGILMDIPRLKGVPYLEPGTPIFVEDLEAWEKHARVKVSAGDACSSGPDDGRGARRSARGR